VKTAGKMLFLYLLFFIFSTSVFAVGIRPARLVYPFQEGRELSMEYTIINRGSAEARFAIYTCGTFYDKINISSVSSIVFSDLDCTAAQRKAISQLESGDITLDQAGIFLKPHEEKQIQAKIKLPSIAGFEPGIVDTRIGAVDLPLAFRPGETVVGGIAAVEAQLWLRVPYPGIRLVLSPVVESTDGTPGSIPRGKKARIKATVSSEGTEDVKNAVLTIDILDSQGVRKGARIDLGAKDIPSGELVEYPAVLWDTNEVEPGSYTARFRLSFGSQSITEDYGFKVGGLEVAVTGVEAQPVVKGGIAKIIITAESKWGDVIPNVFADVFVEDGTGKQIASVRTQSIEMRPFGTVTLESFWETKDAPTGKYGLTANLHYASNTSQGTGKVEVRETLGQQTPLEYVLLAIVVILVIAGAWFLKDRIKIEPESRK